MTQHQTEPTRYAEYEPLERAQPCGALSPVAPWRPAVRCGRPALFVRTIHVTANTWSSVPVCETCKREAGL